MNDREEWWERVRDIRAASTIWWWWWFLSNTKNLHNIIWYQVFQSNINNLHNIIWYQVCLFNTYNLQTVPWFLILLSNTNYLHTFKCYQVFLSKIGGCPRGVMVKAMDCGILVSSFSSRAVTSTFRQIPLGEVWAPLSSQLWVRQYHYCSPRKIA